MPEASGRSARDGREHRRLSTWWQDDPADPDRPEVDNPEVQRLAARICPGAQAADLGGVMSLNMKLEPVSLVLRVHQPFVSRERLLALQEVRRRLADGGLIVPVALLWRGTQVFRCGKRWAELEEYQRNERLAPAFEAYRWLFEAMGVLHRALATLDLPVPRPVVVTYAPPGSLRRWLPVTAAAVQDDPEAMAIVQHLRVLIRRLDAHWLPASQLPQQLVHGDIRLSNVRRIPEGGTVYFDFGFLAWRPRVHDLAYALAFMALALEGQEAPERFDWRAISRLVVVYEEAAETRLTAVEWQALAPYAAAVLLYHAALDGFSRDPAGQLRTRIPFLRLGEWLLAHLEALGG